MAYKLRFINIIVYATLVVWTFLITGITALFIYENYTYAESLAENEAVTSIKKDIAYRSWVASHGGVYVPITEKTKPNPLLSHVSQRDITTTTNKKLTLINPSQSLSEVMQNYASSNDAKGHITSTIQLNKNNAPDTWERQALNEMRKNGGQALSIKSSINDIEYFRYIEPFITEEQCMKCHAIQGYKVGEVNGAVSVSIPLKTYKQRAYQHSLLNFTVMLIIYIIGVLTLLYGKSKARVMIENKIQDYEQHIFSLVNIIEKRDHYTAGHTKRVAKYSVLIAEKMGFSDEVLDDLHRASMLHDIGKISTPDSILLKPGVLTSLENDIIQEHVVVSYEILSGVDIYKDIAEIVRHHHEHYDGTGYPQGLKGDEIPLLSQIMTVADSFDAMTTNRIYKARKSVSVALEELKNLSGKQFHTEVVNVAAVVLKDIEVETTITQRAQTKIEEERFSYFYKDQLTGTYNKDYLEYALAYNHSDEFSIRCINIIYLHHFNSYNKKYSWGEGDQLLQEFADVLKDMFQDSLIFRIYGDDFIVANKEHCEMDGILKKLQNFITDTEIELTYKHIDIKESEIYSLQDLEKLL